MLAHCSGEDVGQLQAQQQEDQTVKGELQQGPDAAVEQARRGLPGQQIEAALHHPRRDRRQNAGQPQVLGGHIGGERQQQKQQHVRRRVLPAAGDHPGAQTPQHEAEGDTDGQTAEGHQDELHAGIGDREHSGQGRRDRELERHQTGGIVHQRLAL